MFKKYELKWHPLFMITNFSAYIKILIMKPRFEIMKFTNSSLDVTYEKSYYIGWMEIRVRRNNNE
jgi:hypothetical protein